MANARKVRIHKASLRRFFVYYDAPSDTQLLGATLLNPTSERIYLVRRPWLLPRPWRRHTSSRHLIVYWYGIYLYTIKTAQINTFSLHMGNIGLSKHLLNVISPSNTTQTGQPREKSMIMCHPVRSPKSPTLPTSPSNNTISSHRLRPKTC